jgi:hypothetical protein
MMWQNATFQRSTQAKQIETQISNMVDKFANILTDLLAVAPQL